MKEEDLDWILFSNLGGRMEDCWFGWVERICRRPGEIRNGDLS